MDIKEVYIVLNCSIIRIVYRGDKIYNHAPKDYICPFCLVVLGVENEHVLTKQADIVYKDNYIMAFISAGQYKNNKGNVIIIPNSHFENIYLIDNIQYSDFEIIKHIFYGVK